MAKFIRNLSVFMCGVCVAAGYGAVHAEMIATDSAVDSGEVMVYGASKNLSGQADEVLLEQPATAENPLGNPIVSPDDVSAPAVAVPSVVPAAPEVSAVSPRIEESLPQNPSVSSETPQEVNQQIQDTLYESGGRIYDVQSYPASDVKKIEEPNLNPTINTYPSY